MLDQDPPQAVQSEDFFFFFFLLHTEYNKTDGLGEKHKLIFVLKKNVLTE